MEPGKLQQFNQQLQRQTGIDFARYRDPELVDAIGNAITFPLFLARSLSRPTGFMLLLLLSAFVLTDSAYFRGFLTFPGFLLAVINGILLGLVLFIRRIRNDMKKVFAISSDLSLQVLQDIDAARVNLKNDADGFPSLLDIFQGVNGNIILPVIKQTLDRKIPFIGKFIARLTERFFNAVNSRLSSGLKDASTNGQPAPLASPAEIAAWLQSTERIVHSARGSISKVVDTVSRVIAFPFLGVFSFVFLLSCAILYGSYRLLA